MTARLHDDGERRPRRDRDAFSSALVALRTRLRRGDYVLGEPLIIKNLSQALGLSTTPIREALARLSGEGLVEERRGSGYFAPPLGVTELSELYHDHETLVLSVLGTQPLEPAAPSWSDESPHSGASDGPAELVLTERLFDAIIRQTGNRVVFDAYRRVADRLAPARLVEGRALQPGPFRTRRMPSPDSGCGLRSCSAQTAETKASVSPLSKTPLTATLCRVGSSRVTRRRL